MKTPCVSLSKDKIISISVGTHYISASRDRAGATPSTHHKGYHSTGLAAISGSCPSPPLSAEGWDPPVTLAIRRRGPAYIASYSQNLEPWPVFFEVLQLLIWLKGLWIPFLTKEDSCSAFSSLPSSTLGLWHRLRPVAWDTAVALAGGGSFYSCSVLATGLLEEEPSVLCILGWILRRQAMALASALFGPWPDSSMSLLRSSVFTLSSEAGSAAPGIVPIILNIKTGGRPSSTHHGHSHTPKAD